MYDFQTMSSDKLVESDKLNVAGTFLLSVPLPLSDKQTPAAAAAAASGLLRHHRDTLRLGSSGSGWVSITVLCKIHVLFLKFWQSTFSISIEQCEAHKLQFSWNPIFWDLLWGWWRCKRIENGCYIDRFQDRRKRTILSPPTYKRNTPFSLELKWSKVKCCQSTFAVCCTSVRLKNHHVRASKRFSDSWEVFPCLGVSTLPALYLFRFCTNSVCDGDSARV